MDIPLVTPQPLEYMSQPSYWPNERIITTPNTLPGNDSEQAYLHMNDTFHLLRERGVQPVVLHDSQDIPQIPVNDGMVRLVIDEFKWVQTSPVLKRFTKPTSSGVVKSAEDFNAAVIALEAPDLYEGPRAKHIESYTVDGHAYYKQLSRSVVYAAVDIEFDGWFGGIVSCGVRHRGITQKIVTLLRGYQEFIYAKQVGDINAYNPDDNPFYNANRQPMHQVIMRTKVAAAAVFYTGK